MNLNFSRKLWLDDIGMFDNLKIENSFIILKTKNRAFSENNF